MDYEQFHKQKQEQKYKKEEASHETHQNRNMPTEEYGVWRIAITIVIVVTVFSALFNACGSDEPKESDMCFFAKEAVKDILKSPSSADFSSCRNNMITEMTDNRYGVVGYVEAENSFGANLKTRYAVILEYLGDDDWEIIDVALNE